MVYLPGGKSARVYPPTELVVVWRLKLVSGFVATTLAPTIAACVESTTLPFISPSSACAWALAGASKAARIQNTKTERLFWTHNHCSPRLMLTPRCLARMHRHPSGTPIPDDYSPSNENVIKTSPTASDTCCLPWLRKLMGPA